MTPKIIPLEVEADLNRRIVGLDSWLRDNAPHVFDEQTHLDAGSEERAYWHYGYLMALRDLRNLIFSDGC